MDVNTTLEEEDIFIPNHLSNHTSTLILMVRFLISLFGSREEDEVAGFFLFSHIRMRGYFRLC